MIRYFPDLIQGSEEWHEARRGLITASEMKLLLTPTLKAAKNGKSRAHLYELLAQRITGYVEPSYISDDMLRGQADEIEARAIYAERYAPVSEVGFITNDEWGFSLGYSPDGIVGDDGLIECKSRRQGIQIETIIKCLERGFTVAIIDGDEKCEAVAESMLQIQTGMLVSRRVWCDYVSYSGGLPMAKLRIWPDAKIQEAIIATSRAAENRISEMMTLYRSGLDNPNLIPTERRIEQEMYIG